MDERLVDDDVRGDSSCDSSCDMWTCTVVGLKLSFIANMPEPSRPAIPRTKVACPAPKIRARAMEERLVDDNVRGDSSCDSSCDMWTCTAVGLKLFLKHVPAAASCPESNPERMDVEEDVQDTAIDWSFIANMPEPSRPAIPRTKVACPAPKIRARAMDERLVDDIQGDSSCEWTCTMVGLKVFLKPVPAATSCPESNSERMNTQEDVQDTASYWPGPLGLAIPRTKVVCPAPKRVRKIRARTMDERPVDDVRGDSSCESTCTAVRLKPVPAAAESCPESNPEIGTDTVKDDRDGTIDWSFIADMPELPRPAVPRCKPSVRAPKWVRNIQAVLKQESRRRPAGPRYQPTDRQGTKRPTGPSDRALPPAKRPRC
ncbi:hypothetical protein NHX12_005534 [Muraenolepis orangiensis]|uniref:Uncharacterized protein n=1 Tax=Muraenolepis orangiensis TaxID=630683 RepID=A0A9Q0DRP8_9TELE|nr:hypothetical protein NHX12_005534 [Muraenolepis orangiensis]